MMRAAHRRAAAKGTYPIKLLVAPVTVTKEQDAAKALISGRACAKPTLIAEGVEPI